MAESRDGGIRKNSEKTNQRDCNLRSGGIHDGGILRRRHQQDGAIHKTTEFKRRRNSRNGGIHGRNSLDGEILEMAEFAKWPNLQDGTLREIENLQDGGICEMAEVKTKA